MKYLRAPFHSAALCVLGAAVSGCGGGGSSATPATINSVTGPVSTTITSGPVSYMQNSGTSSSGTIAKGTSSAVVAVISADAQPSQPFAQDTLTVNGAASTQSSVRAVHVDGAHAQPPLRAPEAFAVDDRALLSALRSHAAAATPNRTALTQTRIGESVSSGSQSNVWVQQGASRTNIQVPATLLVQSTHGNIWVQNTIVPQLAPYASQLASDFENAYASDTAHFASPDYPANAPGLQPQYTACAPGGAHTGTGSAYVAEPQDGRIDVMVVDSSALGGLGGYFTSANFMTQAALNCLGGGYESNQGPFIFVGWFSSLGTRYELQEDFVRSTAHELQHLINFVNHSLLAPAASNPSFNGSELQYVNEGLSMLAQDFAVDRLYGAQGVHVDAADALQRAQAYMHDPSSFSISGFTGIDAGGWSSGGTPQTNCFGGCYGGAYLFMRYLSDRFGDSFARSMETSGAVGAANLQTATAEPAGELLGDFALALAADSIGAAPSDARFAAGVIHAHATYVDQFGGATTLSGVQASAAVSGATTVHAPVGGLTFVSVPSVPASGMTVQVTDQGAAGGFSLLGGLAEH